MYSSPVAHSRVWGVAHRYGDAMLAFELPGTDEFGVFDDGAWSVGGYDESMLGLRSQGPFKRLKFAPGMYG